MPARAGLPDFSCYKIPKWEIVPNNQEIYQMYINLWQMAVKYSKINQHIILQDPPKFTQICFFGLKIITIWQPCA
jgi:hypothetical protein